MLEGAATDDSRSNVCRRDRREENDNGPMCRDVDIDQSNFTKAVIALLNESG